MKTDIYKPTTRRRGNYEYERFIVTPVKTRSGKTTRRNFKKKTETLSQNVGFRDSTSRKPWKRLSYKVQRDDTHKLSVRKKVGSKRVDRVNRVYRKLINSKKRGK